MMPEFNGQFLNIDKRISKKITLFMTNLFPFPGRY